MPYRLTAFMLTATALLFARLGLADAVRIEARYLIEQAVNDGEAGEVFAGFGPPVINKHGRIAFVGVTSENQQAVFSEQGGRLRTVVRAGQPVPGTGGKAVFACWNRWCFGKLVRGDAGQVAFFAKYRDPERTVSAQHESGLIGYLFDGEQLVELVREHARPTGELKGEFNSVSDGDYNLHMNGRGQVVLSLRARATFKNVHSRQFRVYRYDGKGLKALAHEGLAVPDRRRGTVLNGADDQVLGESGHVVFRGNLYLHDRRFRVNSALYRWADGKLTQVVRFGDPAWGSLPTHRLHGFTDVGVMPSGRIAMMVSYHDQADKFAGFGVYLERENRPFKLIARTGFRAPGGGDATRIESMQRLVTGSEGRLAFWASLVGPGDGPGKPANSSAIFYYDGDRLTRVVESGTPVPGAGGDVRFERFEQIAMNAVGQIVFRATLTGRGIPKGATVAEQRSGIYLATPGVGVMELARVGKPMAYRQGQDELRSEPVRSVSIGVHEPYRYDQVGGNASPINDAGQVAFTAYWRPAVDKAAPPEAQRRSDGGVFVTERTARK